MGNYNRNDDRGSGRSFGGGRRDFGRGNDRPMFRSVCSNCGNDCEVPFKPTSGKPVYCSSCFEKMGNGGRSDSQRSDRPAYRAPGVDSNKALLEAIASKLDKIITLLEPKAVEKAEVKEVKAKPVRIKKVTPVKK